MGSKSVVILVFALAVVTTVECNSEDICRASNVNLGGDKIKEVDWESWRRDALFAWKTVLIDPNNVLQSWDPTLVNPCTWFHITCNRFNSVIRVDLGEAGLSGPLGPQLGNLTNLQYLEVFGNNLSGTIPWELGQLSHLVSLDLYKNQLSGQIPLTLGNLKSLSYMRLNSNKLSGKIPVEVFQLIELGHLRIMNVSDNQLVGSVRHHRVTVTRIIQDAKA